MLTHFNLQDLYTFCASSGTFSGASSSVAVYLQVFVPWPITKIRKKWTVYSRSAVAPLVSVL
jgi:hypothetical protein